VESGGCREWSPVRRRCPKRMGIALAVIQTIVATIGAHLGVHLRLHPPGESVRIKRAYKTRFIFCGIVSIALIAIQTYRNDQVQQFLQRPSRSERLKCRTRILVSWSIGPRSSHLPCRPPHAPVARCIGPNPDRENIRPWRSEIFQSGQRKAVNPVRGCTSSSSGGCSRIVTVWPPGSWCQDPAARPQVLAPGSFWESGVRSFPPPRLRPGNSYRRNDGTQAFHPSGRRSGRSKLASAAGGARGRPGEFGSRTTVFPADGRQGELPGAGSRGWKRVDSHSGE
jgi:hypothetical protein